MSAAPEREGEGRAREFLARLADPAAVLTENVAVVVAHPDDETLGCGAQLPRFADPLIVHVTDGAPGGGNAAEEHGFADPASYAAARRGELEAAMALAGIPATHLVCLGVADQGTAADLVGIARRLAETIAGADAVLTHAYEGGHPDHDATAFTVRAACALLARQSGTAPALIEMPFYHRGPDGWIRQSFSLGPGAPETAILLSADETHLKRQMMAAHWSQADVLRRFSVEEERFRPATPTDFTVLPNGGSLIYEWYDWGLTGDLWRERAAPALHELELDRI